jgi:hypothetical protein
VQILRVQLVQVVEFTLQIYTAQERRRRGTVNGG